MSIRRGGPTEGRTSVREKFSLNGPVDDVSLHEQQGYLREADRRRARVVMRSDSLKPSPKLSLRASGKKTYNTLPQSVRQSRLPVTPTQVCTSPQANTPVASPTRPATATSSLRIRSPTRQPWGAPSIRNPTYQQQNFSRRKKISDQPQQSLEPKQSGKPQIIRYTVGELLALRPRLIILPTGFRRTTRSSSGISEHTIVHHNVPPSLSHIPNFFPQHFPAIPADKIANWRGDVMPTTTVQWPFMISPLHHLPPVFASEGWNQSSIHDEHPRTQSLDSPIKNHSGDYSSEDQAASVEDLETKIRSALSNRGRRRSMLGASRNLRSVRWDPSVVTNDPEAPNDTLESRGDSTAAVCATVVQSQNDSDIKVTEIRSHSEMQTRDGKETGHQKQQKKDFYGFIKDIAELKKGDRKKLLHLLEAMSNVDSDDFSSDDEAKKTSEELKRVEKEGVSKKLNPAAVAFSIPTQLLGKHSSTLDDTAKVDEKLPNVHHRSSRSQAFKEPPIADSSSHVATSRRSTRQMPHDENMPQSAGKGFLNMQQPRVKLENIRKRQNAVAQPATNGNFSTPSYVPFPFPIIPLGTVPLNRAPLSPPSPLSLERDLNPYLPIVDLSTGQIPSENEHGREAHALGHGELVLKRYKERYPMTGTRRPDSEAAANRSSHAAHIQQRLEYLLMEQKERKAAGEALMERGGNHPDAVAIREHYDKQVLKRLKSEIRREDMARKSLETSDPRLNVKIIVSSPIEKRHSEASEDSSRSISTPNTDYTVDANEEEST